MKQQIVAVQMLVIVTFTSCAKSLFGLIFNNMIVANLGSIVLGSGSQLEHPTLPDSKQTIESKQDYNWNHWSMGLWHH